MDDIVCEESIKDLIYEIRGTKVMLDFDLARVYGYETKKFNQQIKRNIEKFPSDFMFQISKEELEQISWSQKVTLNKNGDSRGFNIKYLPYAFTEQGIYMLMTVLRGETAIKQSISLIRLFKTMKDYIVETNNSLTTNEVLRISRQVNENTIAIERINSEINKQEKELKTVMDNFVNPHSYKHFVFYNGERIEADVFYRSLYSFAKNTIIIVDDYIGIKTLEHLKVCNKSIQIIIFTDNVARPHLAQDYFDDYINDTGINIVVKKTNNTIHDRLIIIDYEADNELIYLCGPSSKDAGNKIASIVSVDNKEIYHPIIEKLIADSES